VEQVTMTPKLLGPQELKHTFLMALSLLLLQGLALAQSSPAKVEWLIRSKGGRVDWGPQQKIAYDAPGKDGYTDVWVMDEDGANRQCLTSGHSTIPQLHNGNPAWHPSGKLLVFQALDPAIKGPLSGTPAYRLYTGPGAGFQNDIWVMDNEGDNTWRLTTLGRGKGVLHPHFSPDGKWLVWAEMTSSKPHGFGTWDIVLAPFLFDGQNVELGEQRRLRPGDHVFYETHGFSPDSDRLIFSAVPPGEGEESMDIFVCDLQGENLKQLTSLKEKQWDEHAHFSPDGSRIVWMSSSENGLKTREINNLKVKTDCWQMASDGSQKSRVTTFNKEGTPHYIPGRNIASDISFSPDGRRFVLYVQDKGKRKLFTWGSICIVTLQD
jgi:Tol biopolymer transport system component